MWKCNVLLIAPVAHQLRTHQNTKRTFRVVVFYFTEVFRGDRPHGKAHGKAAEASVP